MSFIHGLRQPHDPGKSRVILYLLFVISGFAGLIYESIWTHYLKLFLGHAAYAQTLVLAIFMGGMAIGAWLSGKYSIRWKNLFVVYALVECVIGICALFFHEVYSAMTILSYNRIFPFLHSASSVLIYKWTVSSLIILPQSVLLGMTFPLISSALMRSQPNAPGGVISLLYFTNSIGGAVGVLAGGFLLIGMVGLPGTIRIAGAINIIIGMTIWQLTAGEKSEALPMSGSLHSSAGNRRPGHRIFILASLITGAASFIYEISWIRMLSLVLGTSTHAFELMLSAFILGLALGGLWIYRRIDSITDPQRYIALVQVLMGFFALLTLQLYGNTFSFMQYILRVLPKDDTGYALFNILGHSISFAIMLPATFCAGMTLPLITLILFRKGYGERATGEVYAANTAGAILGTIFAVHLGLPQLGLKWLLISGAALDMGLGILLIRTAGPLTPRWLPAGMLLVTVLSVSLSGLFTPIDTHKMASGVYRNGSLMNPTDNDVLFYQDGKTCSVSITRTKDGLVSIRTNGKVDGSIYMDTNRIPSADESTMVLIGAIPLLLHPGAKTAANIGMGTGLTTHTLLSGKVLSVVDTIEIEKAAVEAAGHFRPRVERAFSDPAGRIHIEDAKTYFSTRNMKYDIIVSEPSNPWVSGISGLFSKEFYMTMRHYLAKDGILAQWLHLYENSEDLVATVIKAISENFSDYAVYVLNSSDMLILAKNNGTFSAPDPALFEVPTLAAELNRIGVYTVNDVKLRKMWDRRTMDHLLKTYELPANSDFYPVLDLNAVRARYLQDNATGLISLLNSQLPLLEMLGVSDGSWKYETITPVHILTRTQQINTGKYVRDYCLNLNPGNKYGFIPAETREYAEKLRLLIDRCGSGLSEDERARILFGMPVNLLPFTGKQEIETIWKQLRERNCMTALLPSEILWLNLFRAVGMQDPHAMAEYAELLLRTEKDITAEGLRYVVGADMLAHITIGDNKGAARIWSAYRPRLFGNSSPTVDFRLLAAICQ